ncbi:MAG: lipid A biosynthesis acyltransferase, partial [Luteolibacter sp.]
MPRRPTSLLKRFQWRLECALCSVIEAVAGLLPGAWVFYFGEVIAGIVWHVMPRRRKIVMRNLRSAFADKMETAEIQRLAKNSFRRTGGNMFSAMHTAKLPSSKLEEVLEIENMELMEQALS